MAESDEISMEKWLDMALNPIGSLALVERFDESRASLLHTFSILSHKVVDLILSPYGFRIVESFLNVDLVYERLAESLSEEWSGLEQVLKTEKGRYVCETLLKKNMKLFAHRIITIAPRDWWLKNIEALTILIKAISFSDIDVAKEFIFHEQIVIDLCDAPEGLYCVLKVMEKSRDQPGWKEALANLILLKSKSTTGCEALAQAILYGDYLVNEIVEIICSRHESIDNSTVSLIIRLIEHGSAGVKELVVKCLCEINGNPVISQIRNAKRFANFTLSQRKRLDDCIAATRVHSIVDDCVTTLTTNESDSMSTPDVQNKKRRSESNVTSQSAAKKPREEGAEPCQASSETTVHKLSTVTTPPAIPTVSTVSLPPTVTTPSTVPTVATTSSILPPPTVPPQSTVTTQPTVSASATVPIPTTTPSVKPAISSLSPTIPTPASVPAVAVNRLAKIEGIDPGMDVINMAMSEKYRVILSKLAKGTPNLRLTVYNCIRNALLPLMMDERGSEVVKWFIVNGTPIQKEEIERKVEENMEDLVTNGGYGRTVAQFAIDNCADLEKKKELSEKSMKAMESSRDSPPPALVTNNNEVEIVGQKINKKPAKKSTVAKAIGEPVSQKIDKQPDQMSTAAKVSGAKDLRSRARTANPREATDTRQKFMEIDEKMSKGTFSGSDLLKLVEFAERIAKKGVSQLFIDLVEARVATWAMNECGTELLSGIIQRKSLRPHLVYAVASVLHKLQSRQMVKLMLFKRTAHMFAHYCISNHVDSPIAKLFRADMDSEICLIMAMEFVKTYPEKMHDLLLSPTGRIIAGSENGRRFIELVAKPQPVGRAWSELLHLVPSAPIRHPHTPIATVKSEAEETTRKTRSMVKKQAIATARSTVVPPHQNTVSSSQMATVSSPLQNTVAPPKNESPSIFQYVFSKLFS